MSFISEKWIAAVRKARMCDGCGKLVKVGHSAVRWAGTTDGDFGTALYHPDCREAEVALNDNHGWRSGDDWFSLLNDTDGDDRAWLKQAFPAVFARMFEEPQP